MKSKGILTRLLRVLKGENSLMSFSGLAVPGSFDSAVRFATDACAQDDKTWFKITDNEATYGS
jgi:hypothetical protein